MTQRYTVLEAEKVHVRQRKTYTESFISFCVFDNQEKKVYIFQIVVLRQDVAHNFGAS